MNYVELKYHVPADSTRVGSVRAARGHVVILNQGDARVVDTWYSLKLYQWKTSDEMRCDEMVTRSSAVSWRLRIRKLTLGECSPCADGRQTSDEVR